MLHPLFSTIVQRPDLIIDHFFAYGLLFRKEATNAGTELLTRVIAGFITVLALVVFMILTGIAIMLGVMHQFHWILIAVPAFTLFLLIAGVLIVIKPSKNESFPELKAQIENDALALRTVS